LRRGRRLSSRPSLHGFTLVELLVVIALIALLLAMLTPSLERAKELARCAVCMSNGRQMGAAFHTYAAIYDKYLPPDRRKENEPWVEGHNPGGDNPWGQPTWDMNLWEAHGEVGLYGCPSDEFSYRIGSSGWGKFKMRDGTEITKGYRSYSILVNGWYWENHHISEYGVTGMGTSRSLLQIPGTDTILVGEVHTVHQIMGHYSYSGLVKPNRMPGWSDEDLDLSPDMYHDGQVNWTIVDGHVERARVLETIGSGTPDDARGWWSRQMGD
jgi:prepilin-type N-terminal cleavage/methylation domain-containing protein